jgi:hypothetical protein
MSVPANAVHRPPRAKGIRGQTGGMRMILFQQLILAVKEFHPGYLSNLSPDPATILIAG